MLLMMTTMLMMMMIDDIGDGYGVVGVIAEHVL